MGSQAVCTGGASGDRLDKHRVLSDPNSHPKQLSLNFLSRTRGRTQVYELGLGSWNGRQAKAEFSSASGHTWGSSVILSFRAFREGLKTPTRKQCSRGIKFPWSWTGTEPKLGKEGKHRRHPGTVCTKRRNPSVLWGGHGSDAMAITGS